MLISRARRLSSWCFLVVVTVSGALLVGLGPAQAQPGAASAVSAWTPTTLTGLPHGPDSDGLESVSCPAVGSCFALGRSSALGSVVETLADGVWSTTVLAGPGGTGVVLSSLSCPSTTSCDAVGYYGPSLRPVLARLHNGTWSYTKPDVSGYFRAISCAAAGMCTVIGDGLGVYGGSRTAIYAYVIDGATVTQSQLSIPADLSDIDTVGAAGISCPTTTNCTAVGTAVDGDSDDYSGDFPFAERLSGGTWTASDLPNGDGDFVSSVSCPDVTTCYAIGQRQSKYGPANGSSYAIKIAGGTTTTTNLSATLQFSTVSCGDATHCVAFGSNDPATVDDSNLPASAVLSGGTWTTELRAFPPPGSRGALASPAGVDCATASFCVVAGSFTDQNERDRFLAETYSDGAWSASGAATIPGTQPTGGATALSCRSITNCVVVGSEVDVTDRTRPQAEILAHGSWTRTTLGSPSDSVGVDLDAVSCVASNTCTAVGRYYKADGTQGLLSESYADGAWTVHRIGLGFASGYQENLTGVDCFSATSCVAAGYHLDGPSGDNRPFAAVLSGTTWTRTRLPGTGALNALACQSATSCVAVGGVGGYTFEGSEQPEVEAWTLSGTTWAVAQLPLLPTVDQYDPLEAVAGVAASSCTALAPGLVETLTGGSWRATTLPHTYLVGISCVAATSCTAVGGDGDYPTVETRTASGWTAETLAAPKRGGKGSLLAGVQCFSATSCIAAGTAYSATDPDVGLPVIEQRS